MSNYDDDFPYGYPDDGDSSIALLSSILELMPSQQVSKIKFSYTTEPLDPHTISRLF